VTQQVRRCGANPARNGGASAEPPIRPDPGMGWAGSACPIEPAVTTGRCCGVPAGPGAGARKPVVGRVRGADDERVIESMSQYAVLVVPATFAGRQQAGRPAAPTPVLLS